MSGTVIFIVYLRLSLLCIVKGVALTNSGNEYPFTAGNICFL